MSMDIKRVIHMTKSNEIRSMKSKQFGNTALLLSFLVSITTTAEAIEVEA
jgi:hypothetical protein